MASFISFVVRNELGDAKCPAPVPHIQDISFWVDQERFEESTLLHVVSDSAGVGVDVTLM